MMLTYSDTQHMGVPSVLPVQHLDPIIKGCSPTLSLTATVLLMKKADKLTLGQDLTVQVSHTALMLSTYCRQMDLALLEMKSDRLNVLSQSCFGQSFPATAYCCFLETCNQQCHCMPKPPLRHQMTETSAYESASELRSTTEVIIFCSG